MSPRWWHGIAPAVTQVSCDGREHQLRWAEGELLAPNTRTSRASRSSARWPAQRYGCLDALDAWAGHAGDLRVLVLASRGPADPVLIRPETDRTPLVP